MKPINVIQKLNEDTNGDMGYGVNYKSTTEYQKRLDDIYEQVTFLQDDVKDSKPEMYKMLDEVALLIAKYSHYHLNEGGNMKPIQVLNKLKESWSDDDFQLICGKLGISPSDVSGGIIRFRDVDINVLIDLVEAGYARPDDRQNNSPSIQEIIDFYHYNSIDYKDIANFKVSGYVVVPSRSDYRISVDEVSFDFDDGLIDDVSEFIESADEKSCENNHAEAWWD